MTPYTFKAAVRGGHQKFGSLQQQDAQEFYLHIMKMIDHHQCNDVTISNPVNSFKFEVKN